MSSARATRRNGKAASCEPCRKGKIRCDHQRPVCSRCQRRGITAQCIYHPAPLTKPRPAPNPPGTTSFSPHAGAATPGIGLGSVRHATDIAQSHAFSFALPSPPRRHPDDVVAKDERLSAVRSILALLQHCSLMQMLLREYTHHAQAALVPAPIAMAFVNSLPTTISSYALDEPDRTQDGLTSLAKDVLCATARPVVITPETSLDDFTSQFIGPNLRLQTLALIFSLTARSCLLGLARDDDKREDLMYVLASSSSSLIRMGRDLAVDADDVSIWAAFEDCRLATHLDGDSSPRVYRRLGELATDMYALGIHRESANTFETPFFIAECRRKTFGASYQLDKFVATLMDRPPRILRRHSDCKLPLDLTDQELLSSATEGQALSKVTSDGWNVEGKHMPASWQRLRFVLGTFREEILEYRLRPPTPESNAELRNLSQRCRHFVDALPTHLRYSPECWNSEMSIPVCLMLTGSHLNMLQSEFQIQRLLELSDATSSSDLLQVSAETIATILQIGAQLNRAIFLRHDFPYMALTYGLPTASRLAVALKSDGKAGSPPGLPATLSRSTIIRNLSVYVSHLESVFSPTDGNYELCRQAAKSLSKHLDEVLESPMQNPTPTTPLSTNGNRTADGMASTLSAQDLTWDVDAFGMADHDILSGASLDAFDWGNWAKNIDWNSGSWNPL